MLQGTLGTSIKVKHVVVTVAQDGTITCAPDPVTITSKNALIAFNLATDGWHFPDTNAIALNAQSGDFPYSSWTIKPQLAGIADLCNSMGPFEYTVTVVNDTTGQTFSLDPVIHNGTGCDTDAADRT